MCVWHGMCVSVCMCVGRQRRLGSPRYTMIMIGPTLTAAHTALESVSVDPAPCACIADGGVVRVIRGVGAVLGAISSVPRVTQLRVLST